MTASYVRRLRWTTLTRRKAGSTSVDRDRNPPSLTKSGDRVQCVL